MRQWYPLAGTSHPENKTLNQLSDQVAHDLANQVESLVNLLYLIKGESDDPTAVLRYVGMTDPAIRCLVEIIKDQSQFATSS